MPDVLRDSRLAASFMLNFVQLAFILLRKIYRRRQANYFAGNR